MRAALVSMLFAIAATLLLPACNQPTPAPAEAPATEASVPASSPPPEAMTAPPTAGTGALPKDAGTQVAGIAVSAADMAGDQAVNDAIDSMLGDHARYQAVILALQKAVADDDKAGVAALVQYPFRATIDGKAKVLGTAKEFVSDYDRIVTPAIAAVIGHQKYADLFVNYKGVMFGQGEVWINGICKDDACKVFDVKVVAIQPAS